MSIATFACAFAPSLSWLTGLRAIQGLAASSFAPTALAYLGEAIPVRRRAVATGAMSTSFLVAGIFGQVLAAWVVLRWEWYWVFLITGICLLVAIPFVAAMVREPERAAVNGHLGYRFIELGAVIMRPAVLLLSCAHIMLLLSFVALYTALGPHLEALGLEPENIILLRMAGLPGMFVALLAGLIAGRIGMQGVAITGYMFASFGLFLVAVLPQSLTGVAIGSLIFVAGVALAIPAMITQFGTMSVPNRAGGMALNGFILFIGASTGPLIVADVSSFTGLLIGLAVVMLLAATCVAGSASLTANGRRR